VASTFIPMGMPVLAAPGSFGKILGAEGLGRFRAYRRRPLRSNLVLLCWTPFRIPERGEAMQHVHEHSPSSYNVTALFADRALSFALAKGATFEDLANRLTFLSGRAPLAVIVNLGSRIEQEFAVPIAALPA
jgi:hypothetical protein